MGCDECTCGDNNYSPVYGIAYPPHLWAAEPVQGPLEELGEGWTELGFIEE